MRSNETRACRWRAADAVGEGNRLHFFFSAGGFGHMPSFLMRGKMVVSVLQAISHLHNAKGSALADARTDAAVAAHFAQHGTPDVCILVKYGGTRKGKRSAAAAGCKAAGALVLFDCIDRHACFNGHELSSQIEFREVDGFLAQTEQHRQWLSTRGAVAALLPHPHGNTGGWGRAPLGRGHQGVGNPIRSVGFMVGSGRSLPKRSELDALAAACCSAGAQLVIVRSPNALERRRRYTATPQPCPTGAKATGAELAATHCKPKDLKPLRCGEDPPEPGATDLPDDALAVLPGDVGGQARFYNSSELSHIDQLDVALLWPPQADADR